MKKIAFYVEGQTEQVFIRKLLIEIAGQKNIHIELIKYAGKNAPTTQILTSSENPENPKYSALINDCAGDGSVKPRILEDSERLFNLGYTEIIGIRDLYPMDITELPRLENGLKNVPPMPAGTEIIVAVHEVEAWFLAETEHYQCIDVNLTIPHIQEHLGFDPIADDMTLLNNPASHLNNVYHLVGKSYSKKKNHVERTVSCLDYANIYFEVQNKIEKLNYLIGKIDAFLT